MLHYLLYKALADERARDLVAVARRRQLVADPVGLQRHVHHVDERLVVDGDRECHQQSDDEQEDDAVHPQQGRLADAAARARLHQHGS